MLSEAKVENIVDAKLKGSYPLKAVAKVIRTLIPSRPVDNKPTYIRMSRFFPCKQGTHGAGQLCVHHLIHDDFFNRWLQLLDTVLQKRLITVRV